MRSPHPNFNQTCQAGKQLGSLLLAKIFLASYWTTCLSELLQSVRNLPDFARVLVLDKWACNADGRQLIFSRKTLEAGDTKQHSLTRGTASMPASGRSPTFLCEACTRTTACTRVSRDGIEFEPALSKAEGMDADAVWQCATDIPESKGRVLKGGHRRS